MDFFVKNTKVQIRRKISGFLNINPRKFENLYILIGFINTVWISESIEIYKPMRKTHVLGISLFLLTHH